MLCIRKSQIPYPDLDGTIVARLIRHEQRVSVRLRRLPACIPEFLFDFLFEFLGWGLRETLCEPSKICEDLRTQAGIFYEDDATDAPADESARSARELVPRVGDKGLAPVRIQRRECSEPVPIRPVSAGAS